MPGRLVMERDAVKQPDGGKKDGAQTATTNAASNGLGTNAGTNGLSNGTNTGTNRLSNGTTKGEQQSLPPELEHWAHTYVSMGTLLERMAQQCYHDLGETIEKMADMPVNQPSPQVNGASISPPDPSPQSIDKKLQLMNFAQTQKDRFIKALVLADWARNMDDMNKMIDLRAWLQQQDDATSLVADAIVRLKHNMIAAKMPNPNIQGALELLSTSRAPWVPDLGYIPPKPLSAQKLLKTLRDMNFALSVRLNLHEELPRHLCDYSIANGRATFVVPHEFELDLAVADEEPQSPFYFIDIRFLFSNAPPLPDGFVRSSFEGKLNQILELDGLSACYDFLHGFVLTHKITLLRRHAFELARSRWSECLKIEPIHRSLVIQYWTGQSGGKNWIEIGIAKGLGSEKPSAQTANPVRLNIRWFRGGKETSHVHFHVDSADPSMERILDQVTAAHIALRLTAVRDRLRSLSPLGSVLTMDLYTSPTDPNSCYLAMKLGPSGSDLTLRIVPVTGNISISPVTAISTDVEQRLNADTSVDAAQIITYLHCKLLQDQITRQAIRTGWLLMPTDKQQNVNKVFASNVIRRTTFTRQGWGERWAIAVSIGLGGAKWWIVHLADSPTGRSIQSAESLAVLSTATVFDRQALLHIESKAVAQVSLSNIASQLRNAKIHHEIRPAIPARTGKHTRAVSTTTAIMNIKFEDLVQPDDPQLRKAWKPWCNDAMVLTHHGVDESCREEVKVTHVLKAAMSSRTASDLAKCVKRNGSEDISFSEQGVCALQLRTRFGVDLVSLARARLRRVERLSICLRVLRKHDFELQSAAFSCLTFKYQSEPPLSAEVIFSENPSVPIQLRLLSTEPNTNPHRRIQPLFQRLLIASSPGQAFNTVQDESRFDIVAQMLTATLPLLRGFMAVEAHDPSGMSSRVSTRNIAAYRLTYSSPLPSLTVDLSLQRKNGRNAWLVQLAKERRVEDEELVNALKAVWKEEKDGVVGLTSGAVAELGGIEDLLMRMDTCVRERKRTAEQDAHTKAHAGHEVVVLD